MNTIKFENPKQVTFNPMFVKKVEMIHSDYNEDWCIVLTFDDNSIFTSMYKDESKTKEVFDYVNNCIESIG